MSCVSSYDSDGSLYNTHSSISTSLTGDQSFDTLSDLLHKNIPFTCNHFNVCHINAQSIPAHYNDLLDTFSNSPIHAVLISETWLKPSLQSTQFSLPGFVLIRNDRTGIRGGGVAMYLRSNISYQVLDSSPSFYSASPEFMFVSVDFSGAKLLLGVIYCPPNIDYHSQLENILEVLSPTSSHHLIMGDFNTCLLKNNSKSTKLLNIFKSVNMSALSTEPTHHAPCSDTWLDVMFTSSPEKVSTHGQLLAPGFSHHDLIYASYRLRPPKVTPKVIHMRNLKKLNKDKLLAEVLETDWTPLHEASTVNDKVDVFNNIILHIFDKHAPIHPVKIRKPAAPWITEGVRMAMRRRNHAFGRYKRDRVDDNWNAYKAARNRCNQMCRAAKRRYFSESIENATSAQIWKFLNSQGIGKANKILDGSLFTADIINQHLINIPVLEDSTRSSTLLDIQNMPSFPSPTFFFSPISESEICKSLKSISSKAIGCDNISRDMILLISDHILPAIAHIFNFSLINGDFPASWRKALVRPIPKVSCPSSPNDVRPISILPFLSKVLEAIILKQLSNFVNSSKILSPYQSGFRPGHSTTTALMKVLEDIRAGMEETMVTILVLVDFSNAFNTVDPHILLAILSHFNFSPSVVGWFHSYLFGRQQAVCLNDTMSCWGELLAGVPQGGILSPLLFSLFINLATTCLSCSYHLYADDLQLYAHSSIDDLDKTIVDLNFNLTSLLTWSNKYGITVNPKKCQAIIVGSSRLIHKIDMSIINPLVYNNTVIPFSQSVKNLGLHIDSNLSWSTHINEISRKVHGSLHSLYAFKNFLPLSTKRLLVQSLIIPIFDYADSCYSDLNVDLSNKLERLLNNCIRFIFKLRKYDHISSFRAQLHWLPLNKRRNLRMVSLLYSILSDPLSPGYLKNCFTFLSSSNDKELRSSYNLLLKVPPHHTGFFTKSFSVEAVRLWNKLPLNVKKASNRATFKTSVHRLLLAEDET